MKKRQLGNLAFGIFTTLCLSRSVLSYEIVDRAKLIDDRFKTQEMMRPFGHNFYLDIKGSFTTDVMDLTDDVDKFGKIDTGTEQGDIDAVNDILDKYYDKEQVIRAGLGFGFPIFSFNAFDVNFKPNFRANVDLLAILTPQKESLTMTQILRSIGDISGVPQDIVDKLITCANSASVGDDLLVVCVPSQISEAQKQVLKDAGITSIPYVIDVTSLAQDVPAIDVYAKGEVKAGLWFDYTKGEHFFGTFGLYGLGRIDIKKNANVALLLGDSAGFDDFAQNTLINAALDYKIGYKNSNYSAFFAIEEFKLSEISSEDNGATPDYGTDPLLRLHAQADYNVSVFKMSPYAGFHKRSGYGFADGMYVGANWGVFVWDDRIGLNINTGLDKEHMTLGLRTKLWLMHLDLTGKFAITSKVDDIEVSNYYSANFRIFF